MRSRETVTISSISILKLIFHCCLEALFIPIVGILQLCCSVRHVPVVVYKPEAKAKVMNINIPIQINQNLCGNNHLVTTKFLEEILASWQHIWQFWKCKCFKSSKENKSYILNSKVMANIESSREWKKRRYLHFYRRTSYCNKHLQILMFISIPDLQWGTIYNSQTMDKD